MITLGMVGPWQVVVIVILVLLLFGGKKIPELMRGLGQGMNEFKKATNAAKEDPKPLDEAKKDETKE